VWVTGLEWVGVSGSWMRHEAVQCIDLHEINEAHHKSASTVHFKDSDI